MTINIDTCAMSNYYCIPISRSL
ncbi:protein of unknown function [Cyanobium sp. NIES-981]|nr:protein of unknown function [Cyanobium sp. NIES-981]